MSTRFSCGYLCFGRLWDVMNQKSRMHCLSSRTSACHVGLKLCTFTRTYRIPNLEEKLDKPLPLEGLWTIEFEILEGISNCDPNV